MGKSGRKNLAEPWGVGMGLLPQLNLLAPSLRRLFAPPSCQSQCSMLPQPCQTGFPKPTLPDWTFKPWPMLSPLPEIFFSSIVQKVNAYTSTSGFFLRVSRLVCLK